MARKARDGKPAKSSQHKSSNVPGTYLGFSLQTTRFLEHMLKAANGDTVCLEVFEDVGVEKADGSRIAEQNKSNLTHNPLADRALDFCMGNRCLWAIGVSSSFHRNDELTPIILTPIILAFPWFQKVDAPSAPRLGGGVWGEKTMRRHGAKNADYRGGVTCLYDTQLPGACLHASEFGGRSRPEAVRGMPDVPIAPPATGPPEGWAAVGLVSPASFNRGLWARLLRVLGS